jgi:hypothetical protein
MEHDSLKSFALDPAETAAARWEKWVSRLENFILAKGITSDNRKKGMLLHYAGEDVFELSDSLGVVATTSFDDTKTMLTDYFVPQRNTEYEVFMFRQATQLPNETLDQFHTKLKQLAKNCEFHNTDREIKSQIIQKCQLGKVRDKGLREANISLIDLLKFGRTLEATALQCKAMSGPTTASPAPVNKFTAKPQTSDSPYKRGGKPKPKPSNKDRQSEPPAADKCGGCGSGKHKRRHLECPAWGKTCFKCQKKNHYGSVCRKADNNFIQQGTASDQAETYDVGLYRNAVDHQADTDRYTRPYVCELTLNGVITALEVDTGSAVTIINANQLGRLRNKGYSVNLDVNNLPHLRTYSGEKIQPLGRIAVSVRHQGKVLPLKCLVVEGTGPNLLGRDWLEIIKLDWTKVHANVHSFDTSPADAADILRQFPELFKPELGTLQGTEARLYVDPDCKPQCFKPRVVPFALRSKVEQELDRLQAEGVIKPVEYSEWAAPIVPVLKHNGEVRICGDYKVTVNKAARVDKYPIPCIDDLYSKLAGGSHYSKLDLSHAYQQIRLSEESQKLTTITTSKGLFAYTRLCYGVSSAPGIFQRIMEQVVQGIPKVAVYLDDILVSGGTEKDARDNLIAVLSRLQSAGLRLRPEKCSFLQKSCTYLGHYLDQEGIHPTEDKVIAIRNAPVPTDVSQLRSFLGLINYYHKFLRNLSAVLAPLHELLQSDAKWIWKDRHTQSFNEAKKLLLTSQVLVHFDPKLPLMLSCDASPYGVGAVLSHQMPDGTDKPIAFASRTLAPAEKNYAHLEREGLSVIFGVTKFHKYLYGREFFIQTDHKPLLGLLKEDRPISPMASARIQRWALTLGNYQYRLQYKPGAKHGNADGLSRLPVKGPDLQVPIPEEVVLSVSIMDETPVTAAKVSHWTDRDPTLSKVKKYAMQGWPVNPEEELVAYTRRQNELSIQQGCLLWGSRVIVPPQGREDVLKELHFCHPGIVRMKALARSHTWWPGIDDEIEAEVRNCSTCQEHSKLPTSTSLHPWEWPGKPWFRIHIDFAGPMDGKMILVIVDAHSKYIDAHVMSSSTSAATITRLRQTFATHGLPSTIVSDNGTAFTSKEFQEFCSKNGIKHIKSSPYHPASNGLAERAVQTVKKGIKKTPGEDMETRLYRFLFQYRSTPQSTTGEVPAELLMGRRPRSRLDLISPSVQDKVLNQQSKSQLYRGGNDRIFHVGDTVIAMNFGGTPKWMPGVLEEKLGPLTFTVRLPDGRVWKRHIDHIKTRSPHEECHSPAETLQSRPYSPSTQPIVPSAGGPLPTPPPAADSAGETDTGMQVSTQVPKPQPVPKPSELGTTPALRRSTRVTKPPEKLNL